MPAQRWLLALVATLAISPVVIALQDPATETAEVKLAPGVLDLKPSVAAEVNLPSDTAILQGFSLEVPREAKSMYLVTRDANADVDLFLVRDRKAKDYADLEERAVLESATARVNETITLSDTTDPALAPGKWWVYAGSLSPEEGEELSFKLLLSFDKPPEAAKGGLPPFHDAAGLTPLRRAMDACVRLDTETSSGSGTMVTPAGLIVTCRHVLEDEQGGLQTEGIYVSFTRSARNVAEQTHIAKLVEADKNLDVALLQVVADIDGQPLEKPNFTWLPMAAVEPELDEDLRCLGYPAIGGPRTLCSISLTRGIVSGFVERKGVLQWLKSDCLISAGNSGGTALNAKLEYVGIPTEALHDPDTMESLGYIRPVSALPKKWLDKIAAGTK